MKNIYLIGDSIRAGAGDACPGYGICVKEKLAGKANVFMPPENCRFAQYTLRYLHEWAQEVDAGKIDIVHWNNGLWDVLELFGDDPFTPLPFYLDMLEKVYRRIRLVFSNAQVIFALNTPVIESMGRPGFMRHNAVIMRYNAAACVLMEKLGVPVNDLYSTAAGFTEDKHSDWVHYTAEGCSLLADAVIEAMEEKTGLTYGNDTAEEMKMNFRRLDFAHEWELYGENIRTEFTQCLEEGKDVEKYRAEVEAIEKLPRSLEKEERADKLFNEFLNAPLRADYAYQEPSDYEGILAARPKMRKSYEKPAADEKLYEKVYGAWIGRICGCLLGKPVEGMYSDDIEALCKAEGNFPLSRYMGGDPEAVIRAGLDENRQNYLKSCYKPGFMPADDDTNYTCMAAMKVIDRFGKNFTPDDMAHTWLESQPMSAYCTAERVAFMNFAVSIAPPESAVYKNPFREWIGAQIRGDYFGYINPGNPEEAAREAYQDACISHVKNGIYGEMFIAAALAAAAVTDDVIEVLAAGLNEIPEKSRLAEDVKHVIEWYQTGVSKEECFSRIHTQWDERNGHDWCHTNSNAMIVAAVLLYGGLDYTKTICMAVETGFDTDCNGATAGSILGMMKGKSAVGPEWYEAIDDQVQTSIVGLGTYRLAELSALTMKHIREN